jgi:hypothetical protein
MALSSPTFGCGDNGKLPVSAISNPCTSRTVVAELDLSFACSNGSVAHPAAAMNVSAIRFTSTASAITALILTWSATRKINSAKSASSAVSSPKSCSGTVVRTGSAAQKEGEGVPTIISPLRARHESNIAEFGAPSLSGSQKIRACIRRTGMGGTQPPSKAGADSLRSATQTGANTCSTVRRKLETLGRADVRRPKVRCGGQAPGKGSTRKAQPRQNQLSV